jgi:hypothetical protein
MAHHANANACELGPAAGRQRFLNPLAVDQGTFRQSVGQSKALPKHERFSAACKARSERGIWQRRFWEHMIRDEAMTRDMSNSYINPLKHRLVTRVRDWPYSSFSADRGGEIETIGEFGEQR